MSTGAMTRLARRAGEEFIYTGFTEVEQILSQLSLPGVNGPTGNFAEADADPFFDALTGDLDFRMDLIMPDYTPSVNPHQKTSSSRLMRRISSSGSVPSNSSTSR